MPHTSTPPIHGKVYCLGRYGTKVIEPLRQLELESMEIQAVVPSCEAVYPLTSAPHGETMPEEEMGSENRLAGREGMALLELANTRVDQQLIVIVADITEHPTQIAASLLTLRSPMMGASATVALIRGSEEGTDDEAISKTLETMNKHADLVISLDESETSVEACLAMVCAKEGPAVLCGSPEAQALIGRLVDVARVSP